MVIDVTCPNGHQLKIKEKYAGQTGLCPKCQSRVFVPEPEPAKMSEDAIVDLLGPPMNEDDDSSLPVHQDPKHRRAPGDSDVGQSGQSLLGAETRDCPKCRKKVPISYHICPNCWTYFSEMAGSSISRKVRFACPRCGADVVPGDPQCQGCGLDLSPA